MKSSINKSVVVSLIFDVTSEMFFGIFSRVDPKEFDMKLFGGVPSDVSSPFPFSLEPEEVELGRRLG